MKGPQPCAAPPLQRVAKEEAEQDEQQREQQQDDEQQDEQPDQHAVASRGRDVALLQDVASRHHRRRQDARPHDPPLTSPAHFTVSFTLAPAPFTAATPP